MVADIITSLLYSSDHNIKTLPFFNQVADTKTMLNISDEKLRGRRPKKD